jgi:predicted methyltransferase
MSLFDSRPCRRLRLGALLPLAVLAACASAPTAAPTLSTERIAAIVASPDRPAGDRQNDARRKPAEMLEFIGVRPGMQVLDIFAAGGYTSELLARSVGPTGHVYAQARPPAPQPRPAAPEGGSAPPPMAPAAPPMTPAQRMAARAQNAGLANLSAVVAPFESPAGPPITDGSLDLVTFMFNYHDMGWLKVDRGAMNASIFKALKPGGLYVIADHAGRAGTGISESDTLHRVEEDFVIREVEAAGFKLAARGTFLRNPNDPRDRNEPDPPMAKDEFVLKFVKPT